MTKLRKQPEIKDYKYWEKRYWHLIKKFDFKKLIERIYEQKEWL